MPRKEVPCRCVRWFQSGVQMLLLYQLAQWNGIVTNDSSIARIYRQPAALPASEGEIHLQPQTQLEQHLKTPKHAERFCTRVHKRKGKEMHMWANRCFTRRREFTGRRLSVDTSQTGQHGCNLYVKVQKSIAALCHCPLCLFLSGDVAWTAQQHAHQRIYYKNTSNLRTALMMRWPLTHLEIAFLRFPRSAVDGTALKVAAFFLRKGSKTFGANGESQWNTKCARTPMGFWKVAPQH